jgi:hypothetical protein
MPEEDLKFVIQMLHKHEQELEMISNKLDIIVNNMKINSTSNKEIDTHSQVPEYY